MKTGLSKKQKTTAIFFNEGSDIAEIITYNTSLKNRLRRFAQRYPELCQLTNDDGQGELTFEIQKKRLSFRLIAPYSEERRKASRELAKQHTENFWWHEKEAK